MPALLTNILMGPIVASMFEIADLMALESVTSKDDM